MYRIRRANGEFYAAIAPNIILGPNIPSASPAPINLVGRNKVSYGEAQNENFLWLVENFSSTTAPVASVKGQLWYDYTNDDGTGSGGELKITPVDNAIASQWLTVPIIAETNIEPSRSSNGRLIIYKKNRFKIRMENSWHTIVTEVPQDKLFSALLEINNNADAVDSKYTTVQLTSSNDYALARFNEGGYLNADGTIGGTDEGILRYGSVYQFEAEVMGRRADNPNVYKVWKIKGSFVVDKKNNQPAPADPRRVVPFNRDTLVYEVITEKSGSELWDVYLRADTINPNSGLISADILDGDYYGIQVMVNANQSSGTVNTQWSVRYTMTGIPNSTHATYQ